MQEVLTDDPDFLRGIIEAVVQEILEMEMTQHIGAAPYERSQGRKGQRNGYKARILRTRVGKLEPAGASGPGGKLLPLPVWPPPAKRESAASR